ncbi:hypothetical protein [Noviherbaspirillum aerium]|uniref:hypothetical protein n=1 Tax=Noviherbaspirillum aerium TaxID=2588497 RepID=UPI00124CE9A1|nr:hypothetical protein [Noviherbaspirillum aerium]
MDTEALGPDCCGDLSIGSHPNQTSYSASRNEALEQPEAKTRAASQGVELSYMPPEALDSLVKKELNYWGGVIKKANITLD